MSGSRTGRARLDSKGLSSFKLAIASLDCKFIFDKAISHLFHRSFSPKCKHFIGLHFGFSPNA
jgi:hypothetical protein